jgi:hypothetical protein
VPRGITRGSAYCDPAPTLLEGAVSLLGALLWGSSRNFWSYGTCFHVEAP